MTSAIEEVTGLYKARAARARSRESGRWIGGVVVDVDAMTGTIVLAGSFSFGSRRVRCILQGATIVDGHGNAWLVDEYTSDVPWFAGAPAFARA